MPRLSVAGADLHYETYGSGPAVVFAHGLGGAHLSWWQQVPAFWDRFTCVTFSHRGFHPSTGEADPARFAADLAALVDHLSFADVRLVAQSMGGWTCLEYALSAPDRVRALVMAETIGTLDSGLDPGASESRAGELFRRGIHPAAGERMAREQPALHHLYLLIDLLSAGLDKNALRQRLIAARTRNPDALAALDVPRLWLFGEESYLGPEVAGWVERRFPGDRLVRVPRAGHSIYFEHPELFNSLLGEFLDSAG